MTWGGNADADWLFAGHCEFFIDEQSDATVLFTRCESLAPPPTSARCRRWRPCRRLARWRRYLGAVGRGESAADTVEAYAAALNEGDVGALRRLIASDVVGHEPTHEVVGFEAFKTNIQAWLDSYSDLVIATGDLFGHRDRVAWRWRLSGCHRPTDRRVSVEGIIIFRVAHGRIAEYWGQYDRLGMLEQQAISG